jgi:hypothetical protein
MKQLLWKQGNVTIRMTTVPKGSVSFTYQGGDEQIQPWDEGSDTLLLAFASAIAPDTRCE